MPLGKRGDCGCARFAGLEVEQCTDLDNVVDCATSCGFDFIVAPLVNCDRNTAEASAAPPSAPGLVKAPFPLDDIVVAHLNWSSQVVGRTSSWIAADAPDAQLAAVSVSQLTRELQWAMHLGLQAVMLPRQSPENTARYAHTVHQALNSLGSMALWHPVPLTGDEAQAADAWMQWHSMRSMCEHHPLLGAVLELGPDLPPQHMLEQWLGEPVKVIVISASCFLTNNKGFAVLPRAHQHMLTRFFTRTVQVVLRDMEGAVHTPQSPAGMHPGDADQPMSSGSVLTVDGDGEVAPPPPAHPLAVYWNYLSYLFRKQPTLSEEEALEADYRDLLQAPLQPLQDNLESSTYETFERDAAKYIAYEEAVYRALMDRVPEFEAASRVTIVMVVGAGRGPLVRASIQAAARAGRLLRVYAVEKNANALISIQQMLRREGWGDRVELVGADMRHWQAPELADILVSELLGSFGDNELSPECLDGAQHFLKPDGISIPCSYTSYLQPITTHKLWNDIKAYKELKHFETPYVVKLWRYAPLGPIQPVFSFEHPNRATHIDNTRYIRLSFDRAEQPAALCHGFAGYFDTLLYKGVTLSIHPDTHTPDMFSWFPIYFPLKDPLLLPAGVVVEVSMWRCVGPGKVWYEWAVVGGAQPTPLHNAGGRSYHVGL